MGPALAKLLDIWQIIIRRVGRTHPPKPNYLPIADPAYETILSFTAVATNV